MRNPRGQKGCYGKPDVKARLVFLYILRKVGPRIWKTLHSEVWGNRDPVALIQWAAHWNIVDDWLLDVARDTLEYWTADPHSPDATLDPAYRWFLYRPQLQDQQEAFRLILQDPTPIRNGPLPFSVREIAQLLPISLSEKPTAAQKGLAVALKAHCIESIEEFKARVMRACEEQLRAYEKDYHHRLDFAKDPETWRHAEWTVARFGGAKPMHIVECFPGIHSSNQPDKLVGVAVKRFAERIGLTLPRL